MIARTAAAKSATRRRVRFRAPSWASKKSTVTRAGRRGTVSAGEGDARRRALGRVLDEEEGRLLEAERTGDQVRGEALPRGVVLRDRVVVALPREGDPVLGRGQLFGELHHVLVRLEVRVRRGEREEAGQHATEPLFGAGTPLDRGGAGLIGGGLLPGRRRRVAGRDDRLQRLPLVLHVGARGLHQ